MVDWEVIFVCSLLVVTLASFIWEKLPTDLTAIVAFAILTLTGAFSASALLPDVNQSLAVFANPAPLTIAFMFILSAALERCGAIDRLAGILRPMTRLGFSGFLLFMMFVVGALSAFINNTPVVVVLLPVILSLAKDLNVPASKLLIPLSFSSIFGGTCTLMGTSTNILASNIMEKSGLEPLAMFEIGKLGLPLFFLGSIYLVFASRKLLPNREMLTSILSEEERQEYFTEAFVPQHSELVDTSLADSGIYKKRGVRIIEVIRRGVPHRITDKSFVLKGGDRLMLAIRPSGVAQARGIKGMELFGDDQVGLEEIASDEGQIVEGVIGPKSTIAGQTIREAHFRQCFRMVVVAVHREGRNLREQLDSTPLTFGDTLLMMGTQPAIENLRKSDDVLLLDKPRTPNASMESKMPLVLSTAALVVGLATFNVLPIVLSTLLGCCILFLSGIITPKDGYASIDWGILMLIYGMLGIGQALESTGTTELIARFITSVSEHPWVLLAILYFVTILFTETLSNNATIVIMAPLAISLAQSIGADPRPFVIATCVASSASFSTPIGYQTNTYVYSVGGYRFFDFARIGIPLNLMYFTASCFLVPLIWGF
ncbi:MAG: SLC13 family permease [Opitutales bacterium]|nr:SLC13 family permease [Opitutales bacterium]